MFKYLSFGIHMVKLLLKIEFKRFKLVGSVFIRFDYYDGTVFLTGIQFMV